MSLFTSYIHSFSFPSSRGDYEVTVVALSKRDRKFSDRERKGFTTVGRGTDSTESLIMQFQFIRFHITFIP